MVTGHFYTGMLDHGTPLVGFVTGQVERIREVTRRGHLDQVGCAPFVVVHVFCKAEIFLVFKTYENLVSITQILQLAIERRISSSSLSLCR